MFWVITLVFLAFFHTKGFISHDEGWVLNAAARIVDGQIPYRDFYFLYTPGSILSVALWFRFFGESILSARILASIVSLISAVLLYKIVEKSARTKLLAICSVLLFLAWGPFQINFVWMVMLSITSGLATIYFFTKSERNVNYAYLAGIFAGITLLFKQNFGAAILISSLVAFIFNSKLRTKENVLVFISGYGLVIGVFVLYLILNNSFIIFINQMYYLLFQKILVEGMLSSPFIYPDAIYRQIIKLILYTSPFIISVISIYILRRENKKLIFIASFAPFYYLVSIRPTTDIIHLAPLVAISGINIALIYKFSKSSIIKNFSLITLIILILLGAYIVIFRGYYRWEAPILSHNIFYKDPKVNIFVDQKSDEVLNVVLPELKKSKSDYIFVYHFAPMFYFISGKKNPTYYDDLQPILLTTGEQEKIILSLQQNRVDTILINSNLQAENTMLTKYILNNYYKHKTIQEFTIFKLYK